MKLCGCAGIILVLAVMQGAVAQQDLDTIWICNDQIPDTSNDYLFFHMCLSDTFQDNRGGFLPCDTGAKLNGSSYINFDYQFTHDSVYLKKFGSDTITHNAPRPGYAGFKVYWDTGHVKFNATAHDSMILWHKGPLSGHKVMMVWAQGGDCGGPINYEYFGQFTSSTQWKRESFGFPALRGGYLGNPHPDSAWAKKGLFELRVLIYNDSIGGDTGSTSAKGCLKLDNMCFIKKTKTNGIYGHPTLSTGAAGGPAYFMPTVSGTVTLTIYSMQGEQLYKEPVEVSAGKRYNVRKFALKNSNLPSSWIHCVQISGAGVNFTSKVVR